eukprot:GCRY01002290.1.p1 GENE.GCRY01002290.1~~GCRY01002290.1.p1  ORF type:complete len:193 (+),score=27.27 GCRY01002290.1:120-698(+)
MGGKPSKILPNLFLGGKEALNDESFFVQNKIKTVVSCGKSTPSQQLVDALDISILHINVADLPGVRISQYFKAAIFFIHEGRNKDYGVYVHCELGVSRSASIATAYFMTLFDISAPHALALIRVSRAIVRPNDGFRRQLAQFELSEKKMLREELMNQYPHTKEVEIEDRKWVQEVKAKKKQQKGKKVMEKKE